jgi:hypothetical protein
MPEHAQEVYITIDGSADIKAQVNNPNAMWTPANTDTTNMGSGGIIQRRPTTYDWSVSFDLADPDVDESSAASIIKILYDGAGTAIGGSGDGIYTVVCQKVSSGGTGGTATTKDPTYTATMVLDGELAVLGGGTDGLVNQGKTVNFANAGATITRATA